MSKFLQRYLESTKKSSSALKPKAADPTAAVNAKSSNTAAGQSGARRVQIFNASESYAPDSEINLISVPKSEDTRLFLQDVISQHYLFESLGPEDLQQVIDCMQSITANEGETIIKQGDLGELFYCIESGTATATVDGNSVLDYEAGGSFGELALIYNSPRAASVKATSLSKLWTLDLRSFRYILAKVSSSSSVTKCKFLKNCSFLSELTDLQITKLSEALETERFNDGEFIITQGEKGDSFYIIEEGIVRCTQKKSSGQLIDLISLKAGDYFGEMALMLDDNRYANCIAQGPVQVFTLNKAKFDKLLGSVQDVLAKQMRVRILQSVPLLSKLSAAKLSKLSSVMRVQSFKPGSHIIKQGEEGSRFYIINEGQVKCTRTSPTGKEEELVRLSTQDYFGERALITQEARKANVVAIGHVECLVLERTSFQSLLSEVQDEITTEMAKREQREDSDEEIEEAPPVKSTNYPYSELTIMRTVGTGTFGRVKMVKHKNGEVMALKYMNKSEVVSSHQEKNIMAEKNLLFECSSSPFVLQLKQTYNTPNQIMMLMEFVQGGELWSYIYEKENAIKRNSAGGFVLPAVKFYAGNVLLAFKHLHARNIAYRDLKPENLLMNHNGYLKVIDFGFAKRLPAIVNGTKQTKTYTLCGTPEYLAPEIVLSKGYDKSVDYWAFGCFLYELWTSRTPFQADFTTKIFQNIIASEKVLSFPATMDPAQRDVVKKLLSHNSVFRLGNLNGGINDILEAPFFADVDWGDMHKQSVPAPYVPNIKSADDTSNFDKYDETNDIPAYTGSQEYFKDF